MKTPQQHQLADSKLIFEQAIKGLGFQPSSLEMMAHKNNIFGSFSMLFANIRGFSSVETSPWTIFRLMMKNLKWGIQAKNNKQKEVPLYLKYLVAHLSSNASGCRYCQAHTAFEAHKFGVSLEKIEQLWTFETSALYTESEKAALRFGFASGAVPNQVETNHILDLEKYFTDPQIVELTAVVSLYGFLNRWNDSLASTLEEKPLQFAQRYLKNSGWEVGKH